MELDQKELILALSILKFQCDYTLDGIFNKKLKEIDKQLLDTNSNRQTIDILSDLLVQLPGVINTINDIKILNGQEKVTEPIVEENNKVKNEIINEDEIVCRVNQMGTNLSSLPNEIVSRPIESPETSKNHDSLADSQLHRRSSKRKLAERAKRTSSTTLKNQQKQNFLKDPKFEHHFYSSSENEEEESEEETENGQVQQQTFAYKNFVQKVEKDVEEETVEIVPEIEDMSLDEIKKLAAENAKRNKRIRYFSSDSEDETNNSKKKRNNKSPTKKSQENHTPKKRGRPPKSKEVIRQENGKEKSVENQEKSNENGQGKSVDNSQSNKDQSKDLNTEEKFPEFNEQDSPKIDQQLTENSAQNFPQNQSINSETTTSFADFSTHPVSNNEEINNGQKFPDEQGQSNFCANNLNSTQEIDDQKDKFFFQNPIALTQQKLMAKKVAERKNELNKFYLDEAPNSWTQSFSNNFKQMNDFQIIAPNYETKINHHYFSNNSVQGPPFQQQPTICPSTSTLQIPNTSISKPNQKKSIGHVLEISSAKIVAKIDADQILIHRNLHDKVLVNKLGESCNKNAKILLQIKLDRFLISIAKRYWKVTKQKRNESNYNGQKINHHIDWYLKDFNVSNSADLRNALVPIFNEAFGYKTLDADNFFQSIIFYTVRKNGVPRVLGGDCKKTSEILNGVGFLEIVKNVTSNRVKFLEFVKKKAECNYEIDFWISD